MRRRWFVAGLLIGLAYHALVDLADLYAATRRN